VVGDLGPSAIWCFDYQFGVSICPSASVVQTSATRHGISRLSKALDSEHSSSYCYRCHLLYMLSYGPLFEPLAPSEGSWPPEVLDKGHTMATMQRIRRILTLSLSISQRIPCLIEMSQMFSRLPIVRPRGQQNWDPIPSNLDTDLGEDLSTMIVLLNEIRVFSSNWPPTPVNVSGCYFEELSERNFLRIKCQNQGCGLTSHGATNSRSPSNFMWGRGHKETAGGKLSLKAAWLFSHTSSNIL